MIAPEIQTLIERQAQGWSSGDVDKIIGDFAPNAIFRAGKNTYNGIEAIAAAAQAYFERYTDVTIEITRIIQQENQIAVEWTWRDRNQENGQKNQAEDAIIVELANGKIIYWREYIN